MPRGVRRDKGEEDNGSATSSGEETTSGYFRRIFRENRKLLKTKSNAEVLQRWLDDHPGHTEVPQNVKNNLANIKSVLRKKRRRGRRKRAAEAEAGSTGVKVVKATNAAPARKLEALEEQIDECLSLAKHLDREGLDTVIQLLRRARNKVVWQIGE